MPTKKKTLYYGVREPSKYQRRATMKEAVEHKQVRYWGIRKIDTVMLKKLHDHAQKAVLSKRDMEIALGALKTRLKHIDIDLNKKKTPSEDIKKLKKERKQVVKKHNDILADYKHLYAEGGALETFHKLLFKPLKI